MSRSIGWGDVSVGGGKKVKPRRKAKPSPKSKPIEDDDLDFEDVPWEDEGEKTPETKTQEVARAIGVDLKLECPVCRTLGAKCDCTEEDRSFQRRVRYAEGVKQVARCDRCLGALSTIYFPRAGTQAPYDLAHMVALWGCVSCHGAALAMVVAEQSRPG